MENKKIDWMQFMEDGFGDYEHNLLVERERERKEAQSRQQALIEDLNKALEWMGVDPQSLVDLGFVRANDRFAYLEMGDGCQVFLKMSHGGQSVRYLVYRPYPPEIEAAREKYMRSYVEPPLPSLLYRLTPSFPHESNPYNSAMREATTPDEARLGIATGMRKTADEMRENVEAYEAWMRERGKSEGAPFGEFAPAVNQMLATIERLRQSRGSVGVENADEAILRAVQMVMAQRGEL